MVRAHVYLIVKPEHDILQFQPLSINTIFDQHERNIYNFKQYLLTIYTEIL